MASITQLHVRIKMPSYILALRGADAIRKMQNETRAFTEMHNC